MPSTRSTDEIMSSFEAAKALSFQYIDRYNLASLSKVQIDDSQLDWFAPVSEIITEAAANPARIPMAIRAGGDLIGFFIFHRDRRDRRCWWLAWYLIDKRHQGSGYGKAAFKRILAHLARIEGCLRIRLQVTPGNDVARSIYDRAGFRDTGLKSRDDDNILELVIVCVIAPLQAHSSASRRRLMEQVVKRWTRRRVSAFPPAPWIGFAPLRARTGPLGMPPPILAGFLSHPVRMGNHGIPAPR
jgi:RimJ/RimL family protein N-acetyltransferase